MTLNQKIDLDPSQSFQDKAVLHQDIQKTRFNLHNQVHLLYQQTKTLLQLCQNKTIQSDLQKQLVQTQKSESSDQQSIIKQLLLFYGTHEQLAVAEQTTESIEITQSNSNQDDPQQQTAQEPKSEAIVKYVQQQRQEQNLINKKKVLMDIEKIRKTKLDKEEQRRLEQEKINQANEKRKFSLKRQIERRRIELGVGNSSVIPKAILQTASETPQATVKQIGWYDLEDEEDNEQFAVQLLIKKHQRFLKNLFTKYSNVGFKVIPLHERGSFEGLKQSQEMITIAEMTKLLKDHNFYPNSLTKDDIHTLFKIVNQKAGNQQLTTLDYPKYVTFLIQVALNSSSQQGPVDKLKQMLRQFEQAMKQKGLNLFLIQDDNQDHETLTRKVNEDPTFPIPEGYTKSKEKVQIQSYQISPTLASYLNESTITVLPILDEIIKSIFDFHILEPFTSFQDQIKIKQVFIKPPIKQPVPVNYPKVGERPSGSSARPYKLAPITTGQSNMVSAIQKSGHTNDNELINEIANILELLIFDITGGFQLESKNEVIKQARERESQQKQIELLREARRRERNIKIKQDLEKLKIEKALRDEKIAEEKKELERQARIDEKKRREAARVSINKVIEEARARDENKPKVKEYQKSVPRSQSKPPTKEQIQKQKQSQKDLMQRLSDQNQLLHQKEEEAKLKEAELKEAIKKKSELQIAQNRAQRQKDANFNSQLQEFVQSDQVVQVMSRYDRFLNHMFKFYCMQAKVDISVDMQYKGTHLSLQEFSKFGYQSKVVPVLLTADEMITVFRVVEKWQTSSAETLYQQRANDKSQHLINFGSFKYALVVICIYSHPRLDNQDVSVIESDQSRKQSQDRVKEIIGKREGDRKSLQQQVLSEMRSEFELKYQKQKAALSKSPQINKKLTQSQSETSLQREQKLVQSQEQANFESDFQKWLKQQENMGNGLQKRIEAKSSQGQSVPQKQLKVQKQIDLIEQMQKTDIRDGRKVMKEMDIKLASANTVEKLLKFIGLQPGEVSIKEMDAILNSSRIEIQGQKPQSKIKRLMLPQLAMDTIKEQEQDRGKETVIERPMNLIDQSENGQFDIQSVNDDLKEGGQQFDTNDIQAIQNAVTHQTEPNFGTQSDLQSMQLSKTHDTQPEMAQLSSIVKQESETEFTLNQGNQINTGNAITPNVALSNFIQEADSKSHFDENLQGIQKQKSSPREQEQQYEETETPQVVQISE